MGAERVSQAKGRNAPGSDGVTLAGLSKSQLSRLLKDLATDVDSGKYNPRTARKVAISKRDGGTRNLTILSLRDRILQQALLLLLHPIAEAEMSNTSYGSRPGLGPQDAILDVAAALQNMTAPCFIIRADISSCFDNIPHRRLQEGLFRRIRGQKVRSAITKQLSKWGNRQEYGVPQGAPLSPLMTNLYLAPIDKFFERRKGIAYFRYLDDFLILVPGDYKRAQSCLEHLEKKLNKLELKLNHTKTKIANVTTGVEFLGMLIRRNKAGRAKIQLLKESIEKIRHKCDYILNQPLDKNTKQEKLQAATAAWAAYYMQFDPIETKRVIRELQPHISTRLGPQQDQQHKGPGNKTPEPNQPPTSESYIRTEPYDGTTRTSHRIKGDTQPAREVRAQNSLPFGAKVNLEGNSRALESQLAAETMATISPKEMSNEELGMKRGYARGYHQYWGAALQEVQQRIGQFKMQRREMYALAQGHLSSSASATRSTVDAYLDKNETHKTILASEQELRTWATLWNQCLNTAQRTIEAIDCEMINRCLNVGLIAVPGRVHMTCMRPAQRKSRMRSSALRQSLRPNVRRSTAWRIGPQK